MLVRYHIYSQDLSFHSCLVTLASCNGRPILNAQQYCNFKFALIQSANSKENLHFQCHALSEKKFRHWNQTGFFVISFPFPVSMSFSDFHKLSCVSTFFSPKRDKD